MPAPLYRRLLSAKFDELPPSVRDLHDLTVRSVWAGRSDVERGANPICRLAAWIGGLPPAGPDQPLRVTFEPRNGREIWTRQFGRKIFRTVQYEAKGLLCEQAGPVTFRFAPIVSGGTLALQRRSVRVLGLPLPAALQPVIATEESERDGRYRFRVEARLPFFGLLVRYAGWLERSADGDSA